MIDLRQPDRALVTLEVAGRRFEQGGPVPVAVRELLVELADALDDSGPLELGVSSRRWLRAKKTARRAVAQLRTDTSPAQTRAAKRALRKLHRVFASASRSARLRARGAYSKHTRRTILRVCAFAFVLIACAAVVGMALSQGQFQIGDSVLAVIAVAALVPLLWVLPPVWAIAGAFQRESVRADAEALPRSVNERLLFAQRMRDGRVAVATDRRVLLTQARPRSGSRASRRAATAIIAGSVDHVQITSVSRGRINTRDSQNTLVVRVTLDAERSHLTLDLDRSVDARALVDIVEHRRLSGGVSATDATRRRDSAAPDASVPSPRDQA